MQLNIVFWDELESPFFCMGMIHWRFWKRRVCFRLMICFGLLPAPLCPLRVVENVIALSKMAHFLSSQVCFFFVISDRDVTLSHRYRPRIRLTETSGVTTSREARGGNGEVGNGFDLVRLYSYSRRKFPCSVDPSFI